MMSQMSKKLSLSDIIEKIDWLQISPVHRGYISKISPNSIGVKFSGFNRKSTVVDTVKLRFGKEILEQMGWKDKDRLCIYNDPDDLLRFLVCKSDNGEGYSLSNDVKGKGYGRLLFKWPHEKLLRLTAENFEDVPYEIYKRYISFRAERKEK